MATSFAVSMLRARPNDQIDARGMLELLAMGMLILVLTSLHISDKHVLLLCFEPIFQI